MRKFKIDASLFLLGAIIILVAAGIVLTVMVIRSDPIEDALSGDRVIDVLFVIEHDGRPLSSFVLFYYPGTKRAAAFEIPGEIGLIIQRINRVDRIDTLYNPRNISAFQNEIAGLLGVDIDFSMVISLEDLGKIVDLIEGVDLFIPSPVEVYDPEETVLFPSGMVRLDGDKARLYLSYELPEEEGELVHFRRQRFFLSFLKKLGEKNEHLKIPVVAKLYNTFLRTEMNNRTKDKLFTEFAGIDVDRMTMQSVAGTPREVSGQTLIFPYYDGSLIKEIVRQSLTTLTRVVEGTLTERVFTVEVLNGTNTVGLAGRTAELLQGFGYDVISIGNAERSDYEKTEIVDWSGYADMARTFGEIIRCQNIRFEALPAEEIRSDMELSMQHLEYRADFTLILGRDFNGRYVSGR